MSSAVVVPIRLVIDSGARVGATRLFAEPMMLALDEALGRAKRDVFEQQGLPVVAEAPSFVWTGEGLGQLTEEQRSEIETAVAGVIARASSRAGVMPLEALPEPDVGGPIAEPYDETRDDGADGYLVDSYAGPDDPRNREVLKKSGGAAKRPPQRVLRPRQSRLARFRHPNQAARALHPEIVAALREAGEQVPFNGLFGTAFQYSDGIDYVVIYKGQVSDDAITFDAIDFRALGVTGVNLDGDGQPVYATGSGMLDASRNSFVLMRVGNEVADTKAAIEEVTRLWLGEESRFNEAFLDLAARDWAKRHLGPGTSFQAQRKNAISGAVSELVRNSGLKIEHPSRFYEAPDHSLTPFRSDKVVGARIVVAYAARAVSSQTEPPQPERQQKPEDYPEGEVDEAAYGSVEVVVGITELQFSLAPFEGELPVGRLGRFGEQLGLTMRTIADLLELPEADYRFAANFAIQAMKVLEARSLNAKWLETKGPAEVKPRSDGTGALGEADITPARSAAVQQLMNLARASGLIDDLIKAIDMLYGQPIRLQGGGLVRAPLNASGMLHFMKAVVDPHAEMNGRIFADACSVAMMQALYAARAVIDEILSNSKRQEMEFQAVYPAMTGVLRTAGRYEELLYRLNDAEADKLNLYVGSDTPPWPHSFAEAKTAISSLLSSTFSDWEVLKDHASIGELPNWFDNQEARSKVVGKPVYLPDGSVVIDDGQRRWTRGELETAIKVRTGFAGSINPLARQMRNVRSAYAAFTTSEQAAREYFDRLLKGIQSANQSARTSVLNENDFALETTKSASATELSGIHRIAYDMLKGGFTNPELFRNGIAYLFTTMKNSEEGWQFVELGLTIGLGLVYAPLGIIAGVVFTLSRLDTALAHLDLAHGLLNPDEILRLGDAELEAFFSAIEIAMFIATDAKELYTAGKALTVARTEARALSATVRQTKEMTAGPVRRILGNLAHDLTESLAAKVMLQVSLGLLLPEIMDRIFKPLAEPLAGVANLDTGFDEALGKLLGVRGPDALASIVAELKLEGAGTPIGSLLEKDAQRGNESVNDNAIPGLGVPITIKPDGGNK